MEMLALHAVPLWRRGRCTSACQHGRFIYQPSIEKTVLVDAMMIVVGSYVVSSTPCTYGSVCMPC